jgi:hypothetical protein
MAAEKAPSAGTPGPNLRSLPVTWRPTRTRAVLRIAAVLLFGVFLLIAVLMPGSGGAPWSVVDKVSLTGAAALFAAGLLMLSRPRVDADEAGVTVVNLINRRRLAWAEIVRVNLRQGDPWALLDLADGSTVPAMGIQPAGGRDQAIRAARELRDLVELHGTAH